MDRPTVDRERDTVTKQQVLDALAARLGPQATATQLLESVTEVINLFFDPDERAQPGQVEAMLLSPRIIRKILHNLHDGIVVVDGEAQVIFFNEAAEEIFCRPRDQVIGGSAMDLFSPDMWAVLRSSAQAEHGLTRLCVRREGIAKRGDQDVPAEISAVSIGTLIVLTVTDLTERKRLEEEAARRLQILQSIIDNIPGAVTVFDGDLEMTFCNRTFQKTLDFPAHLFEDGLPHFKTLTEFNARRGEYGPGDIDAIVAASLERARNPVPHVYERQRPDGSTLEIRGTPLPGGGFVTIYNDITERKRAEEEAKRYAIYLRTILDSLPQGVSVFDENLELAFWNQSFIEVLDLPADFVREGISFVDLIRHNADRGEYGNLNTGEYVQWRTKMAMRFEPHSFERVRPDGRTLDVQGRPIRIGGNIAGFVTTYTDITKTRQADELVRRASELMEDAIGYSPTFVWEVDADNRLTFLKGTPKVLGYEADELLGRRFAELECGGAQCHEHSSLLEMAFANRVPFEHILTCARHKDGTHVWISVSAHPIFDGKGGFIGYRGVNVDVTELTRVRQELERMALHDPLTGLANRRKFLERYKLEVARQKRHGQTLALLVADIDHFKTVNDQFGHLTGDMCLKCVADVLSMAVRKIDIVARFGGEEFIILLPETSPDGALTTAEKLRQAVERLNIPIDTRFEPLNITISLGVACLPAGYEFSFDDLMAIADQGLYGAKQAGRNRVMMYRRLDEEPRPQAR